MAPSDTSEKGLESLIVAALTGRAGNSVLWDQGSREGPGGFGGAGYIAGNSADYDREHAVDLANLLTFLRETQPQMVESLGLSTMGQSDSSSCIACKARSPSVAWWTCCVKASNTALPRSTSSTVRPRRATPRPRSVSPPTCFSVTRQLRYSRDETQLALDLCLFINGLPVATFELKNRLTKQTVEDAVQQYKHDRDPRELLFQFGRCLVHFAVDDQEVRFCTHLKGKDSWFLPFNKGWNDGAGNPPNPMASRPITSGARSSPAKGSPTSSRTTPRSWRRKTSDRP